MVVRYLKKKERGYKSHQYQVKKIVQTKDLVAIFAFFPIPPNALN
jgi:hypothetical protein